MSIFVRARGWQYRCSGAVVMDSEQKQWLQSHSTGKWLPCWRNHPTPYDDMRYGVMFDDAQDALLFKLTWGGAL